VSALVKLSWPAPRGYWEIPVLFEDDYLLADCRLHPIAPIHSSPT
jgi:hypothetical protein